MHQKVPLPGRLPPRADDIICEHRVETLPKWSCDIRYFMQQFQTGRSIITAHF